MVTALDSVFAGVRGSVVSVSAAAASSSSASSSSADLRVLGFDRAQSRHHPRLLFLAGFLSIGSMRSLIGLSPAQQAVCIRADVRTQRLALSGGVDLDLPNPSAADLEARRRVFECHVVKDKARSQLRRALFDRLSVVLRSSDQTGLVVIFVPTIEEAKALFKEWKRKVDDMFNNNQLPGRRKEAVHAAVFHGDLKGDKQAVFDELVNLGRGQICFAFATVAFGLGVNLLSIIGVFIYGMYIFIYPCIYIARCVFSFILGHLQCLDIYIYIYMFSPSMIYP